MPYLIAIADHILHYINLHMQNVVAIVNIPMDTIMLSNTLTAKSQLRSSSDQESNAQENTTNYTGDDSKRISYSLLDV